MQPNRLPSGSGGTERVDSAQNSERNKRSSFNSKTQTSSEANLLRLNDDGYIDRPNSSDDAKRVVGGLVYVSTYVGLAHMLSRQQAGMPGYVLRGSSALDYFPASLEGMTKSIEHLAFCAANSAYLLQSKSHFSTSTFDAFLEALREDQSV